MIFREKKFNLGFTLVELLVVIAIIGAIASIVVAQLSSARDKGGDAAVKQDLDNMRPQAEIYYANNGDSYGNWNGGVAATCPTPTTPGTGLFSDQTILRGIAAAEAVNGGTGTRCILTGTAYAIAVGLKGTTGGTQSWCIDSINASKQFAGTPTAAITGSLCSP